MLPNCEKAYEMVKSFILFGGDVNATIQNSGETALHIAARRGHFELAKVLIDAGAVVDAKSPLGNTPLHEAFAGHRPEIVQLLVTCGSDIHISNHAGKTPLQGWQTVGDYFLHVDQKREESERQAQTEQEKDERIRGQQETKRAQTEREKQHWTQQAQAMHGATTASRSPVPERFERRH